MKILSYKSEYQSHWDEFTRDNMYGTMYHLSGWKRVLEETFGFKPYYLMALNAKDKIEGILPMFLMRDIFQRKYLISNPFANFAGVCANNLEAEDELVKKAKEIAIAKDVQYVEFRQLHKRIVGAPVKTGFVTHLLQLNKDSEEIWKKSLRATTRNHVRKAQRSNLQLKFSKKGIKEFYEVFSRNMRDLGTPVFGIQFFRNILNTFPEFTDLLLAKKEGLTIAGMFLFKYKNTVSNPWASSLREYNIFCPNNLMYWVTIKYACDAGYDLCDFGRSTINSGTYNFKKTWGAIPKDLYYQYFLNQAKKIPVFNAFDNKYDLAIRIWKKIPLLCANMLGPKVVKLLPEL